MGCFIFPNFRLKITYMNTEEETPDFLSLLRISEKGITKKGRNKKKVG